MNLDLMMHEELADFIKQPLNFEAGVGCDFNYTAELSSDSESPSTDKTRSAAGISEFSDDSEE